MCISTYCHAIYCFFIFNSNYFPSCNYLMLFAFMFYAHSDISFFFNIFLLPVKKKKFTRVEYDQCDDKDPL